MLYVKPFKFCDDNKTLSLVIQKYKVPYQLCMLLLSSFSNIKTTNFSFCLSQEVLNSCWYLIYTPLLFLSFFKKCISAGVIVPAWQLGTTSRFPYTRAPHPPNSDTVVLLLQWWNEKEGTPVGLKCDLGLSGLQGSWGPWPLIGWRSCQSLTPGKWA